MFSFFFFPERRDDRIKDWRDFSQKKEKKRKKNNLHVLG